MNRKRLFCAVLALVLLLSAQPATAAAGTGDFPSTIITASCKLPTIRVTVPSTGNVYLNPYELTVSVNGEDTNDQIISTPCCIANESNIPLKVDVNVTCEVGANSDMALAGSSTKVSSSTSKEAFIYFEMQSANTSDVNDVQWDTEYDSSKHIVITTAEDGASKEDVLTLAAMTSDGEVAEGGYASFRLTGDAVRAPTTAWTSNDNIIVTVAFTFTPVSYA